ncbi:MAG: hypothetical protein ACYDD0_01755 [Candidatus Dormibacteria bacterium]
MRELVRSADELRMIRGLVGYASSLAALGAAPGLGAALARTVPGDPSYLEWKGGDFADIVARKRIEVVSRWDARGAGERERASSTAPTSTGQPDPMAGDDVQREAAR